MGIIPERTAAEQEAHDLSMSRAFGETPIHLAVIAATAAQRDHEQKNVRALDESFGEGPIATALAGMKPTR